MILTDIAENQVINLLESNDDAIALRVIIEGGGCSGFMYRFEFADTIEDGDVVVNDSTAVVVVDSMSYDIISESTLDYKVSLQGSMFSLEVPNSTTCGCGNSFTI